MLFGQKLIINCVNVNLVTSTSDFKLIDLRLNWILPGDDLLGNLLQVPFRSLTLRPGVFQINVCISTDNLPSVLLNHASCLHIPDLLFFLYLQIHLTPKFFIF